MDAIIIARVSTEDQKSGPAQLERMRRYCRRQDFSVIGEFDYDESAYKDRRAEFDAILQKIEASKTKVAVCFDKVDRLSRNIFDVRVARLYERAVAGEIELHFTSDGQVINAAISAVEKFQFGMSLGLAKYYSDAISDNVKRTFELKRTRGEITGPAPFGYKSVYRDEARRLRADLVPDPERAPFVLEMFERYARGDDSVASLARDFTKRGVTTTKGHKIWPGVMHAMLSNPFYCGIARSPTYQTRYPHRYDCLVSKSLWRQVQMRLEARSNNPIKSVRKHEFLFHPLMAPCPKCGCSIAAQIKKGKHVYYGCSNAKGDCKRVYVNETILLAKVRSEIERVRFSKADIKTIQNHLRAHHQDHQDYRQKKLAAAKRALDAAEARRDRLVELYLDGGIEKALFERKQEHWTERCDQLRAELALRSAADWDTVDRIAMCLTVLREAVDFFDRSNVEEKRAILRTLFENFVLDGKTFQLSPRLPFSHLILAERPDMLRTQDILRTTDWNREEAYLKDTFSKLPDTSELKSKIEDHLLPPPQYQSAQQPLKELRQSA